MTEMFYYLPYWMGYKLVLTVMCVCVLPTVDTDLDHSQFKKIEGLLDTLQSYVICVDHTILVRNGLSERKKFKDFVLKWSVGFNTDYH